MSPAYARLERRDKVGLTLSPARWATLLSVAANPVDVEALARTAADQLLDEAAWTLPVRYPPDVAAQLARQLSPEHGGSETDMRVAQMTLDEALTDPDSTSIAASVLSGRANRVNSLTETTMQRMAERLAEERATAQAKTLEAAKSENRRLSAEQQNQSLATEKGNLERDLAWRDEQLRRVVISSLAGLCSVSLLVSSAFLAGGRTIAILAVGLAMVAYALTRWCTARDARVWPIFVGAAIDVIGVVSGLMQIFDPGKSG